MTAAPVWKDLLEVKTLIEEEDEIQAERDPLGKATVVTTYLMMVDRDFLIMAEVCLLPTVQGTIVPVGYVMTALTGTGT